MIISKNNLTPFKAEAMSRRHQEFNEYLLMWSNRIDHYVCREP